jgi:alpha-ketoglutarate-dependent taurine dioxygenase
MYSISFEKTPSDYALLKLHTLPKTGGDTLWASAYEAYDRLSVPLRTTLEGLTAIHAAPQFNVTAAKNGRKVRVERGAPDNVGETLRAVHPVIRTNPVTGWKSLYVNQM